MTDRDARRASRRTRVPERGVRVHDRDVEILLAIAKMRLVRTKEIARLFFGAKTTAQKRMRKLFDGGLVRAVVTDLASENRYGITRLGHAFLEEALDSGDVPLYRSPPKADGRSLVHLDLLNAYRVGLAVGARDHGVELLRFRTDWELMSESPNSPLVPDALVSLAFADRRVDVAVEVDTGAEAHHVLKKKLVRYAQIHADREMLFGARINLLLFVVRTRRRATTIAKLTSGSSPAKAVLIGFVPDVTESGGLVSGLWTAEGLADGRADESGGTEGIAPGILGFGRFRNGVE